VADSTDYTPTVSAEYAERIRRWHESAYRAARAEGLGTQTFAYLGRTIVVPPDVMPITPVSHLLGEAVLAEVRESDRVLDTGTGSGVNAILAAGTSPNVLAVDINPHALAAARANAERNGVADRIDVRHSDVFTTVEGTFDLIVFDPAVSLVRSPRHPRGRQHRPELPDADDVLPLGSSLPGTRQPSTHLLRHVRETSATSSTWSRSRASAPRPSPTKTWSKTAYAWSTSPTACPTNAGRHRSSTRRDP
jgi:SAM-dependent methyltransferase